MSDKMDRARAASRYRDQKRAPGYQEIRMPRGGDRCPECADSVARLEWDANRSLWVHLRPGCGFTETPEEQADRFKRMRSNE